MNHLLGWWRAVFLKFLNLSIKQNRDSLRIPVVEISGTIHSPTFINQPMIYFFVPWMKVAMKKITCESCNLFIRVLKSTRCLCPYPYPNAGRTNCSKDTEPNEGGRRNEQQTANLHRSSSCVVLTNNIYFVWPHFWCATSLIVCQKGGCTKTVSDTYIIFLVVVEYSALFHKTAINSIFHQTLVHVPTTSLTITQHNIAQPPWFPWCEDPENSSQPPNANLRTIIAIPACFSLWL